MDQGNKINDDQFKDQEINWMKFIKFYVKIATLKVRKKRRLSSPQITKNAKNTIGKLQSADQS